MSKYKFLVVLFYEMLILMKRVCWIVQFLFEFDGCMDYLKISICNYVQFTVKLGRRKNGLVIIVVMVFLGYFSGLETFFVEFCGFYVLYIYSFCLYSLFKGNFFQINF